MEILKRMTELINTYIAGQIERAELNYELKKLQSRISESKKGICIERNMLSLIIHWITVTAPDIAYNDDQIRYVYRALVGEDGCVLNYSTVVHVNIGQLNENEKKVIDIAVKFVNNYKNNIKYHIGNDKYSYLEKDDSEFIKSVCPSYLGRYEFGNICFSDNAALVQLINLLHIGGIYKQEKHATDTDKVIAEKISNIVMAYNSDKPIFCTAILKNGVAELILS